MLRSSGWKEKREYPRVLINLPIDFRMTDEPKAGQGMAINASETGLLFQTFGDMPIGKGVNIKISFPKGAESEDFRAEAEIIWKDVYLWDDWEGYQYGLKFVQISNEEYSKLNQLLCLSSNVDQGTLERHGEEFPKGISLHSKHF
jgi:hypothetical protein